MNPLFHLNMQNHMNAMQELRAQQNREVNADDFRATFAHKVLTEIFTKGGLSSKEIAHMRDSNCTAFPSAILKPFVENGIITFRKTTARFGVYEPAPGINPSTFGIEINK